MTKTSIATKISSITGDNDNDDSSSDENDSTAEGSSKKRKIVKEKQSRVKYNYKLGLSMLDNELRVITPAMPCCTMAWRYVYDVSHHELKNIQSSIKNSSLSEPRLGRFSDTTAHNEATKNRLQKGTSTVCPPINAQEAALINSANSVKAFTATAWMEWFFDLVGDKIPNSGGDIHLEPQAKKSIYEEYKQNVFEVLLETEAISYEEFCKIWDEAFPHVSIRVFKAVGGKCNTCAILSDLRSKWHSTFVREMVTDLHALHRITYMSERQVYYSKIWKAVHYPTKYWSSLMVCHKTIPSFLICLIKRQ